MGLLFPPFSCRVPAQHFIPSEGKDDERMVYFAKKKKLESQVRSFHSLQKKAKKGEWKILPADTDCSFSFLLGERSFFLFCPSYGLERGFLLV